MNKKEYHTSIDTFLVLPYVKNINGKALWYSMIEQRANKIPPAPLKLSVRDVRIMRDYFRVMLDGDVSLADAKARLVKAGWSQSAVEKIGAEFTQYTPSKGSRVTTLRRTAIVAFLLIALGLALYTLYWLLSWENDWVLLKNERERETQEIR